MKAFRHMETEIRRDEALELVPDNIPPDAILQQRIFKEQRAALQAKNIHNYKEAKLSAEAARTDSQTIYNHFMIFDDVRGDVTRYGTREQRDTHTRMQSYVESSDDLYNAIVSHELAHITKLEAQAATQDPSENTKFQEMATTFHDVVSSQHANSPWGQLLEPDILLMISGLAVPCADTLMLESITHYERYHLHAKQFDDAVRNIAYGLRVYPLPRALPVVNLQTYQNSKLDDKNMCTTSCALMTHVATTRTCARRPAH